MNLKLVSYNLGIVSLLVACAMVFSLVWALPWMGGVWANESHGVVGLLLSMFISLVVSLLFFNLGKNGKGEPLFRKEALATVGLAWILAALLGSLPYLLSEIAREPGVQMTIIDAIYESVSGFTTTGATILTELEDPTVMPRCILFWRSSTHLVGGLGIIVLLVAVLDTGMTGKSLVSLEMTGPKSGQPFSRMQMIVRRTVTVYLVLNVILVLLLLFAGMSWFDALCHSFGTIATGGLGTYNDSVVHFQSCPEVNVALVEWSMATFMFLSGMNLLGIFFAMTGNFRLLLGNTEWRIYVGVVVGAVVFTTFHLYGTNGDLLETTRSAFFQVTSIMTTTGYASQDYAMWPPLAQATLVVLMFVTACSGSTSGGPKIVRFILLGKILRIETERVYRPTIVRPLLFNGEQSTDGALSRNVLIYFAMMSVTLLVAWVSMMVIEPDTLWTKRPEGENNILTRQNTVSVECKMCDTFTTVVAHCSNVGPALGSFGPMGNYAHLTQWSKALLTCVMLLGRLDFFAVLLLFVPAFWRK